MLATGAASVLVLAGTLIVLMPQPLRRLLAPPPVPGLQARLSLDGRLLGHFPYRQVPADQLVTIAPGLQLQREAAAAFLAMQAAAGADGVDLRPLSGFRSIALQKHVFFDVKSERNQSASERARVSAPPGFSEHSTGYALDVGDGHEPGSNLSRSFEDSPAFAWLQRHANRYHFELSFPLNNPQGVSYEPWHWRFEGSADALKTFEAAQRLAR
jgi:D-alanyl-D-alanine carboxypeptidase